MLGTSWARPFTLSALMLALAGCITTSENQATPDPDSGANGNPDDHTGGGGPDAGASGNAGDDSTPPTPVDKIDLLFMVDNSGSMKEEQEALRGALPKLLKALTTGQRDGKTFAMPTKDIHVAVVSSNMGLLGIDGYTGCSDKSGLGPDGYGDDGLFRHDAASIADCKPSYPKFLSFEQGDDYDSFVQDFQCISNLGTVGCGFEQQLESGFKALAKSTGSDAPTFLGMGDETKGHGDRENKGFLRSDALLVVTMITDEEDCSSKDTRHFTHPKYLMPNDPLYMQDPNLRCFFNKNELYDTKRYIEGFKALHADHPERVLFQVIAGVSPGVLKSASKGIDWNDSKSVDKFYENVLAASSMRETVDTTLPAGMGNLLPSCKTATGTAYPPRRLVTVARGFGKNARVNSLCDLDGITDAMDDIVDMMQPYLPK